MLVANPLGLGAAAVIRTAVNGGLAGAALILDGFTIAMAIRNLIQGSRTAFADDLGLIIKALQLQADEVTITLYANILFLFFDHFFPFNFCQNKKFQMEYLHITLQARRQSEFENIALSDD